MNNKKIFLTIIFIFSTVFIANCTIKTNPAKNTNKNENSVIKKEITNKDITKDDSDIIKLYIPIVEDSPEQHIFYHDLLKTVAEEAGLKVELITKKEPQLRIKDDFDNGDFSIFWMVESAERNEQYEPIEVGITNGLIGNRILFIKDGDQPLYDKVNTLDDFRNLKLVGGMGEKWFDVNVWKANNLLYQEEPGTWQSIFKKIPLGRDYNYFSRGLNEILVEAEQYPNLAIEKRLVLVYERDFRFYLSKTGPHAGAKYKEALQNAFEKAEKSGTIERMVRKYWAEALETLDFDNRIKLNLITPE